MALNDIIVARENASGTFDETVLTPAQIGAQAAGDYATLVNGLVPSNQLPSFVDDVLEYANLAAFPATGESGKIYVAIDTRKTFRWSGSAYVEISPSEVTSVAGRTGAITLSNTDISGLGSAATSASTDFAAASHNHAASAITSGVFDNGRINFAAPSAIGAQIPSTGLFTDLSVTSRLNLPLSGNSANDIWVSSGQVRYQSGNLITSARTLLNAEDNLCNLDNTATARTNLGVGSSSAVTFGSIQNTPIGSTTPAAGSFTNLLASAELTVPAVTPASPSTGDLYRNADTLRYRDSSNTERILLNNLDNLANLGNTATARTNIGLGSASNVTFGSIQNTPIGSTTAAAITGTTGTFTTLNATNGTLTASAPVLSLSQTWNNAATTFTGLQFDVTNTASATSSLVARFTIGSTNVFETDVRGFTTLRKVATSTDFVDIFTVRRGTTKVFGVRDDGATQAAGFSCSAGGDGASNMNSNGFGVRSSGSYSISSDSAAFSPDVFLRRDAAGVFAQYNAANPQTYRLYSTFTSTTSFERLNIAAQTGGNFILGTEKGSGGGTARGMELRTDNVARITIGSAGQLGFFGATAAAQPTAVADATDAATVITQLNALLSRMRTLGLIAT